MTLYAVWGRGNRRPVTDADDLAAILDEVTRASPVPQVVGIYPSQYLEPDFLPWEAPDLPALQMGVGHPDRSFLLWLGIGDGLAYEEDLPPWPESTPEIEFEYGGDPVFCGPDRASVLPATAHSAAQQFIASGSRPTNVRWRSEERSR